MDKGNSLKKSNNLFSSTLTFSSKNTEQNSTLPNSMVIERNQILANTQKKTLEEQQPNEVLLSRQSNKKIEKYQINSLNHIINEVDMENEGNPYQKQQKILRNQNQNLKQRNNLLMERINQLRKKNKQYKQLYKIQKLDLEEARQECHVHKQRAQQLKKIIFGKLAQIEKKLIFSSSRQGNDSRFESILESLDLSDIQSNQN